MNKYISYLITLLSLTLAFPMLSMQAMLIKRMQRPSQQDREGLLQELHRILGVTINTQGAINYEVLFTFIQQLPATDENAIQALILLEKLLEEDEDDTDKRVKRMNLETESEGANGQRVNPFDL